MNCAICNKPARLICHGFPGYIEGTVFDIAECDVCDSSFSSKCNNLGFIYEAIYSHATTLQGYSRYAFYAGQVLRERDPLLFLAESEECYWTVAQLVDHWVHRNGRKPRILEIGCGYGYITYALRRCGYEATGVDISKKAVRQARDSYGDFFQCCDVLELAENNTEMWDIIVMTELIEHIEDPTTFVTRLAKLLRAGGIIIVSTPNKAQATPEAIWETELPPVHFWWFTEASMRTIGKHAGLRYESVDLSEYYRKYRKLTESYKKNRGRRLNLEGAIARDGITLPSSILRFDGTPRRIEVISTRLRLKRKCESIFRYFGMSCWLHFVEWKLRGLEKHRHYGKSGPCLCGFYSKQ